MTATPLTDHPAKAGFAQRWELDPTGCWRWTGAINKNNGYGYYRKTTAHRLAYEIHVGPIPAGLQIDHLCRNRWCVNPEHLEAVTQHENLMRGDGPSAKAARQTHCIHGHEFTPENTYIEPGRRGRTQRRCLTCKRAKERGRKRNRK